MPAHCREVILTAHAQPRDRSIRTRALTRNYSSTHAQTYTCSESLESQGSAIATCTRQQIRTFAVSIYHLLPLSSSFTVHLEVFGPSCIRLLDHGASPPSTVLAENGDKWTHDSGASEGIKSVYNFVHVFCGRVNKLLLVFTFGEHYLE